MAALRFTSSNWSRIWLNSTRLTMITTVPATTIVMAPMRTCSDERHAWIARTANRREGRKARRRRRVERRRSPRRIRRSSAARRDGVAAGGATTSASLTGRSVRVTARRSRRAGLVADTPDRQHDLGLLRVALDLGAQALHVDVDQPGVGR